MYHGIRDHWDVIAAGHAQTIYEYQHADGHCQALPTTHPDQFRYENLGGFSIVCVNTDRHIKMVIPDALLSPLVRWYHEATAHAMGVTCLRTDLPVKHGFATESPGVKGGLS